MSSAVPPDEETQKGSSEEVVDTSVSEDDLGGGEQLATSSEKIYRQFDRYGSIQSIILSSRMETEYPDQHGLADSSLVPKISEEELRDTLLDIFLDLEEANTRIERHQAVSQQLREDTRNALQALDKVVAGL